MNFKHAILIICFSLTVLGVYSQESLGILPYRVEQFGKKTVSNNIYGSRAESDTLIRYLFNTLEIPIIDDFSKNRIKSFPTNTKNPQIFDSLSYKFLVDELPLDSIGFRKDTVYNYFVDPVTNLLDSFVATAIKIVFFNKDNVFFRSDSILVFPAQSQFIENGFVRIIQHTTDSILYNQSQSNYYCRDDPNSLWISRGAFRNYTMAVEPTTLGVLTFDGLDSNGMPYDISSKFTYGISDYFLSKPINLYDKEVSLGRRVRYSLNDSIYLSFFYQPEGNGDTPESEDSLVLEFYNIAANQWKPVWGMAGDTSTTFKRVSIHIKDTFYLQNGFQFRFKNYATQSGNFDHWNIDYIRLIENGGKEDEITDFAIINPIRSMLAEYTSVPWKHYKTNPDSYMANQVDLKLRNLSFKTDILTARYKVFENSNVNFDFESAQKIQTSVSAKTTLDFEIKDAPNFFQFPVNNNEREYFNIRFETFSSQDANSANDTLNHVQVFDRYYSYDDGSAEKTYNLNLVETNIAVKFNSPIKDTLKGVLINFIQTFNSTAKQKINLKVYSSLTSNPIYESGPIDVTKESSGNFQRINIPEPLIVEGDFFVGWEQLSNIKNFVGYDVNFNNQKNTFLSEIEGLWFNTSFAGTVMLRVDFGNGKEQPLNNSKQDDLTKNNIRIYPNPTTGIFSITNAKQDTPIMLYSLQGSLIREWAIKAEATYNVSDIGDGIYLILFQDKLGNPKTSKLIISR